MAAADSSQKSKRVVETAEMLDREREAVGVLRCDELGNPKTDGPWLGLALSGGGIRSASFAMGVMQGLQAAKAMKRFDYLSTVSGGGYIGASLSYFLVERAHGKPESDHFWFPFGRKGQDGARGATMRNPPSETPRSAETAATPPATAAREPGGVGQPQEKPGEKRGFFEKALRSIRSIKIFDGKATGAPAPRDWDAFAVQLVSFIRQHAHYLTPSPRLGIFALVANALRAVLFSLGIYFAILVIVMAAVFGGGRSLATYAPGGGCACTPGAPREEGAAPKPVCLPVCTPPPSGAAAVCIPTVTQPPTCPHPTTAGCAFNWWTPIVLPCAQDSKAPQGGYNFFAIIGLGALALAGIVTLIYSVGSYVAGKPAPRRDGIEPKRHYYDRFTIPLTALLGILLQAQLVGLVFGSLPWVYGWAEQHGDGKLYGAISVAISYLGTWREKHALTIGKLTGSPLWKSVWPYLYSILAIYGILFLAFGVSKLLLDRFDAGWTFSGGPIVFGGWTLFAGPIVVKIWVIIAACLAILTGFFGIVTNLNLVSQHRMYRDRLMEAMCPDARNVDLGTWGAASVADAMQMSVLAGGAGSQGQIIGPYHLINTALIIPDSKEPKYSGRGADSFVISPRYCGSDATKWSETQTYMGNRMMLPSAMAISGAALNAHSGPDGKGILRTPMVSFLMTLFGVQLGYWAPNPKNPNQFQTKANYLTPGLFGLLGYDLSEKARFLQLSDGGHFENLGLYELIRRKLDLILVSDGGQDGEFSFADLGNAIERVRVDFGVSIHFDDPDFTLEGVLPQQREALSDTWSKKFGLAKRGFAFASIIYPDRPPHECGVLIYIKATMIEKLPSDLYAYKAENPEFPDQSTIDQFFDEDQFEAYRELGYRLTKQMTMTLSSELVHKWPVTRRLAKDRLDPKPPEQPR